MFSIKSKFFKTMAVLSLLFCFSPLNSAENALSTNNMGWENYKRGNYSKALNYFTRSLGYNRNYPDSLIGAGKCYLRLEIYDRALEMFQQALQRDGNSLEALNGIGLVYGATGKFSQAIAYLKRASKVSGNSLETDYAMAKVYFLMGKFIWSKRKLNSIFRKNPFHYRSLLLMADIKSREKRYDEASKLIVKAIETNGEKPLGHVKYGDILFDRYLADSTVDFAREARESYLRALAINPDDFEANLKMGLLILSMASSETGLVENQEGYGGSIVFFDRALKVNASLRVYYCLGLAYELSGKTKDAFATYMSAYKSYPGDSILRGKLESFLVSHNYKMGNPARVMLSREEIEEANQSGRYNLHRSVIFHLRKSLLLNPLNRDVREKLISYYSILDLNRLVIDEIKNLLKLYPENRYQDRLNLEIIKRRKRLYHREGYSSSPVPRDVPGLFVLNFHSQGKRNEHFDSGTVISESLKFALGQFGRLEIKKFFGGVAPNTPTIRQIASPFDFAEKIRNTPQGKEIDFLLSGAVYEKDNFIKVHYKILDVKRGFVIYQGDATSRGRNSLANISIKIAEDIYDHIPYKGRILKVDSKGILVNLGLMDGIKKGAQLVIYRNIKSPNNNEVYRHGEILKVVESDSYLCYAVPDQPEILNKVDSTFVVLPLKQRRSRLVKD